MVCHVMWLDYVDVRERRIAMTKYSANGLRRIFGPRLNVEELEERIAP